MATHLRYVCTLTADQSAANLGNMLRDFRTWETRVCGSAATVCRFKADQGLNLLVAVLDAYNGMSLKQYLQAKMTGTLPQGLTEYSWCVGHCKAGVKRQVLKSGTWFIHLG